jgi:hypothetical protein
MPELEVTHMELVSVTVTLDVVTDSKLALNAARDKVTKALIQMVNPKETGTVITGASVDRVVRK